MDDNRAATIDLTRGVPTESIADGKILAGRVGEQDVLLVRRGERFFAVRAQCTHYRGPLAEGILVGNTIRCPWHHACFDLATGDGLRAPGLDPLPCWRVERQGNTVFVREPLPTPTPRTRTLQPSSIVTPESRPLVRVMGDELGAFIQALHETHGVVFHLGETVASVAGRRITLAGGTTLDADFIVVGAGVRPSIAFAERSGLKVDRGIVVDEFLETSKRGVFAAGDVARWPDRHTGQNIRIEHWVVAQRQGQTAARNMLGQRERFDAVPFFWSQHYDVTIRYVGHAEKWDRVQIDGSLDAHDASITFLQGTSPLAVATIGRDRACLEAELALESMHSASPSI